MTQLTDQEVAMLAEQGLTPDERYVCYRREGINPVRVAACGSPETIGLMLLTLHEESDLDGRIGLRDALTRKWVVSPYALP